MYLTADPVQHVAIGGDGHYRTDGEAWRHLDYVVQTEGGQETLNPEKFEKKYGWKNDPEKVQLVRVPVGKEP